MKRSLNQYLPLKIAAFTIMISLPFIGFLVGMQYQESMKEKVCERCGNGLIPTTIPTPITSTPDDTTGWKTYRHNKLGFEFKYPDTLKMFVSDNANPDRLFYYFHLGFIPKDGDETSGNLITLTASNQFKTLNEHLNNT